MPFISNHSTYIAELSIAGNDSHDANTFACLLDGPTEWVIDSKATTTTTIEFHTHSNPLVFVFAPLSGCWSACICTTHILHVSLFVRISFCCSLDFTAFTNWTYIRVSQNNFFHRCRLLNYPIHYFCFHFLLSHFLVRALSVSLFSYALRLFCTSQGGNFGRNVHVRVYVCKQHEEQDKINIKNIKYL